MQRLIYITLLISALFAAIPSSAQYSTSNKKAIQTFEQAMSKFRAESFDEADALADKAFKMDPKFVEALWLKADIAHSQMKFADEVPVLKQALKLRPGDENTILGIADAFYLDYQNDSAVAYYNQILAMPRIAEQHRNRVQKNIENAKFRIHALANPLDIKPKHLGGKVNTVYNDYFPALSADAQTLVYTIELPQTKNNPLLPYTQEDIFITYRNDPHSPWQQARSIGAAVNTMNNEGAPFITADGSKLLYTSCTCPDGLIRCCDIYYVELDQAPNYGFPKKMASPVNSEYWESQPCLSADNRTLYFVSNRQGGFGGKDIWYCTRNDNGTWNGPFNLGPEINTSGNETSPFIHADNSTLYFCTDARVGMGGQDIFVTHNVNGKWTEPKNLGYPINTRFDETRLAVPVFGSTAIIASNRDTALTGETSIDLYEISLPQPLQPHRTIFVQGTVYDNATKEPLKSQFQLVNINTGDTLQTAFTEPKQVNILLYLPIGYDYALNVSADGYMMNSKHFSLKDIPDGVERFDIDVPMEKITAGTTIVLNNIFFETDKYDLRRESDYELGRLIKFLNDNPKIKIEIGGHTDNTGSEQHNRLLSQNRANSIVTYLISKGIAPARLTSRGYGSSSPAAPNDTPENRAKNRRTEVKVVE